MQNSISNVKETFVFNKNRLPSTFADFQTKVDIGNAKLKTIDSDKFQYSKDDGKISAKDKLKNFLKGIVSPITNMIKSPKNLAVGIGMIAGISVLTAATGGAIAPFLVATGLVGGAIQLGTSIYKASSAKTDDEACKAWQGMGAGTTAVVGSVFGAKAAVKTASKTLNIANADKLNPFQAAWICIKKAPASLSTSFKKFTGGEFLINLGIKKPSEVNEVAKDAKVKPDTKSQSNQDVKADSVSKPKAQADSPEVTSQPKQDVKANSVSKPKAQADTPEVTSQPKQDVKANSVSKPKAQADVIRQETEKQFKALMAEKDENVILREMRNYKFSEEQTSALQARIDTLTEQTQYSRTLKIMQEAKKTSADVDELMKDPEFCAKVEDFLHTKVKVMKSRYDSTQVETTIDDVFKDSIKGVYDKKPDVIYHGTTKSSYEQIMDNGFSLDACQINESGKGVYFGVQEAGASKYSRTGSVIKARYTGRNIAQVEPGVIGNIADQFNVQSSAKRVLGLDALGNDSHRAILNEIISRFYTNKLSSLGYDAIHTKSYGAGCEYIAVLDPKNIQIIK